MGTKQEILVLFVMPHKCVKTNREQMHITIVPFLFRTRKYLRESEICALEIYVSESFKRGLNKMSKENHPAEVIPN